MGPASVLLAEDLPGASARLSMSLRRCGYPTQAVFSARSALEHASDSGLSLALVQLALAGMGGLQLCRELGKRRPDLPVLLISSSNDPQAARAAQSAGAYDLLVTPLGDGELCYRLECALKRRQLETYLADLREASTHWAVARLQAQVP